MIPGRLCCLSAVLPKPPPFLFQKCYQEGLKVSNLPEPNQQCGVGEGSAALREDSCPAPAASVFPSAMNFALGGPANSTTSKDSKPIFHSGVLEHLDHAHGGVGFFTQDPSPAEVREQLAPPPHPREILPTPATQHQPPLCRAAQDALLFCAQGKEEVWWLSKSFWCRKVWIPTTSQLAFRIKEMDGFTCSSGSSPST